MRSALEDSKVVSRLLADEVASSRVLRPLSFSDRQVPVYINQFGLVPKGHTVGRLRLMVDLFFHSVNDGR